MQLTKQTDYAFRLLMYLGSLPEGKLTNIQQVCAFYNISPHHLAKVVVKLAKLGYINAFRGKGGGLELAKAPSDIHLDQIVLAFEATMKPVNCEQPLCNISLECQLKGMLYEGMQALLDTLSTYTLADVLNKPLEQVIYVK